MKEAKLNFTLNIETFTEATEMETFTSTKCSERL